MMKKIHLKICWPVANVTIQYCMCLFQY